MTIEEAIKHAEEVAENKEKAVKLAKCNPDHPMLSMSEKGITEYKKCINEHHQLAEWLKELKERREKESCENKELVSVRQELLDRGDEVVSFRQLVERFEEVEEEYKGVPWNLRQIYNNFNILIGEEPCKDAVSKQAVFDIVDGYSESQSNVEDVTQDIISEIVALPSVNPQEPKTGHWIPVKEKLPKDYQEVLVYNDDG